MGHLHAKMMNRLQSALLEHDFVIQYKKGEAMLADYLSRLPLANPDTIAEVTQCFDPFQPDLIDLQLNNVNLQWMNHFWIHGQWQPEVSKADTKYLQNLAIKLFQDAYNVVWIRLDNYKYPRTALCLPENYRKIALCEAHNHQFGGHNAALKTYIRISYLTTGPNCGRTSSSTRKHAFVVDKGKNQRTNLRRSIHCQIRNNQMSGSMLTSLDQCWLLVANTSTSCASRTHLQNMH